MALNPTHDPAATSWLTAANISGGDFPIQNLPLSVFRRKGSADGVRGGVAIGDQVLDLAAASAHLSGAASQAATACAQPALNDFFALGPAAWQALRHGLFAALHRDADAALAAALRLCMVPLADVEHTAPLRIGDYTDFYTSLDHAANVGKLMSPSLPVMPNLHWMPIAYHGRVSSIGVSGQTFHRPMGQSMAPGAAAPVYGPCARLDYELELGVFIGQGRSIAQMVAQHTVGGCNLQPGDLLGTGTISGPTAGEAGAIIELSEGGRKVLKLEGSNEQRTFLQDGDAVILRGWCEKTGFARIGFGECRGEVLPALPATT